MKISKKFVFKRLVAFLCMLSLCISIFPARPAKAADVVGNLALALDAAEEVIETLDRAQVKAQIIERTRAAGLMATSETVSVPAAASTTTKGLVAKIGSTALAAVAATIVGGALGTGAAYIFDTDQGFRSIFSYEECLQYIWKRAMGADDETLLAFLYTAMDPEHVEGIADGTLTFQYDIDLSRSLAYTVYDAYFTATPAYDNYVAMDHYGPDPFDDFSDVAFNDTGGYKNYRPIDSYFPAETYIAGAKNFIATQYPDFEADFWIMTSSYLVGYGPRWSAREGYNGAPTMYAYDFPEGSTPIFLYNQTTGRSYLTTYESPSYEAVNVTCDRVRLEAFTYPGLYTVDYSEYGISYHDAGVSTGSTQLFFTPASYTYYYWSGTSQSIRTLNPAEYGQFVNKLGFDDYSLYGIPVYTMDSEGVLSPYNLRSGQSEKLPEPESVVAPADPSAAYNSSLDITQEVLKTEPVIDSYIDSAGSPVADGETESIERDPEPTPTPQPTPPTYDDGTPIFPVFPEFPNFFGEGIIPSLMSGFAAFSAFLAVCLEVLPFEITDAFWWCFVFLLAIALIGVLI